ncbi:hypothetical protein D3C79_1055910 [compost metagenome]
MPAQFPANSLLLFIAQVLVLSLELDMHINAVQVAIAIQMNLITLGKLFNF